MIIKISSDNKVSYEFTGRHIYNFIHYLTESTEHLNEVNKIIKEYDTNINLVEHMIDDKYSSIKKYINFNTIMLSIDAIHSGKKVVFEDTSTLTNKQRKWFEQMYANQEGYHLIPPVKVTDSYQPIVNEYLNVSGHL